MTSRHRASGCPGSFAIVGGFQSLTLLWIRVEVAGRVVRACLSSSKAGLHRRVCLSVMRCPGHRRAFPGLPSPHETATSTISNLLLPLTFSSLPDSFELEEGHCSPSIPCSRLSIFYPPHVFITSNIFLPTATCIVHSDVSCIHVACWSGKLAPAISPGSFSNRTTATLSALG